MNMDIETQKQRIKKYLELENVSVLTGAGTSFHLGAPIIRNIPNELKKKCQTFVTKYFGQYENPSYEDLFNCLQAHRYILNHKKTSIENVKWLGLSDTKEKEYKDIEQQLFSLNQVIHQMQKWLFNNCNTENTKIHEDYLEDKQLENNRYHYHESFIKKLLQRPNNLKRVNLFTTNYDMAFDYALDNIGVHYINGFMGVHNRCFRPEVYDYDLYYPGQSVTGKVHRAEKVMKYFKIHGSLSWISTKPTVSNTYGIKEIPLNDNFEFNADNEIMIYPCTSKKSFTLDLPYSELFRQFAQAINQPQSVLFCVGYSFYDEHINDIINQALTIPSFTLIIANYLPTKTSASPIDKLRQLNDSRIIILDSGDAEQTTFTGFVKNMLPDLYEEEENIQIVETMGKLFPPNKEGEDESK